MVSGSHHSAIDVAVKHVASVYARALLGAAEAAGSTDALVQELDTIVREVIVRHPGLQRLLTSAFVSRDEKDRILDRVFAERISSSLLAFLKVISRHDRFDCLQEIRDETVRRYLSMQGYLPVTLRTAGPLDQGLRREIIDALRRSFRAEPKLVEETDPALIGGLVVVVGDTVYDGSVATRLARLQARMVERCIETIETHREHFLTNDQGA